MNIHITIDAPDARTAQTELAKLLGGMAVSFSTVNEGVSGVSGDVGGEDVQPEPKQEAPKEDKPKRTRKPKEEAAPPADTAPANISTGEERVNPEDDAQDDADEAIEQQAEALTLDSVRAAANPYVKKYGMEYAQTDLMTVLKDATGIQVISKLPPDDQDVLAKVIEALKKAVADNPFKRAEVK